MTIPFIPEMQVRPMLPGLMAPQRMAMPNIPMPEPRQAPATPNLWQRFTGWARDTLAPVPDEYKQMGLFDPETIHRMQRRSLLQGDSVEDQMGSVLKLREYQSQQRQAQSLAAQRQAIMDKYQIPANATPQMLANIIPSMVADFARIGDEEMVGKMSQMVPGFINLANPKPTDPVKYSPEYFEGLEKELKLKEQYGDNARAGRPTTTQQTRRLDQLGGQYERVTREWQDQYDSLGMTIESEVPKALQRDGSAQYAVIVQFVKALDPGSVAREGEVSLARQAQSLWASAQTALTRVQQGGLVDPSLIQQMAALMAKRRESYLRRIQRTQQQFKQRANNPNDLDATFYAPSGAPEAAPVVRPEYKPHSAPRSKAHSFLP